MIRRCSAAVLIAIMLICPSGGAIAAQTPVVAGDISTGCSVEPVGILSLLAILNDVEQARFDEPISTVSFADIVPGAAVSPQDLLAIEETTTQLVGCVNSGQVLSAVGLLTERFQARLVLEVIEGNGLDALLEQLPVLVSETTEAGGIQAIPIRAAWYADAGERSIMAMLEPVVTDPAQQRAFLVTFAFSIDRWLIDDIKLVEAT